MWSYDFGTQYYETIAGSVFVDPRALAFASDGRLWILDQEAGDLEDIWAYDFVTETYETLPDSDFVDPRAFAFDFAPPVPVLGPWGGALLAGFLAYSGARWRRRRPGGERQRGMPVGS